MKLLLEQLSCARWSGETSFFVDGRSMGTYPLHHHDHIDEQNVGRYLTVYITFSDHKCSSITAFILLHIQSNQLLNLNIFCSLFPQMFLLINSISLCFDPWIFCHPLSNSFPRFWLFLVLFWMLWMLVTVHKPCHVPHTPQITTWGTLFTIAKCYSLKSKRKNENSRKTSLLCLEQ